MDNEQIAALAEALHDLPDRIQGFGNSEGSRYWIRDVWLDHEEQVLWRGDSHEEMMRQCRAHRMRVAAQSARVTIT